MAERPQPEPETDAGLLRRTAELALEFLDGLPRRPVGATASIEELRAAFGGPLPERGEAAREVVETLVRAADPGLIGMAGPRYFGFVIGGHLPAALAADWLTSTWDQNATLYVSAPANSVAEEAAAGWLLEILGLPRTASVGFTTGCMMANFTALAAARHAVLAKRGWDVETRGLYGAPEIDVVIGAEAHVTIHAALQMLGLGRERVKKVPTDAQGRMEAAALRDVLAACDGPLIVCAQAGNVNTGAFDPLDEIAAAVRDRGGWLHVDGAFGLWANASPSLAHLAKGAERADSWATDGHKWLNLPFDSGLVFVAHAAAHRASFAQDTSYSVPTELVRNQKDWNPEWSRRGRGFPLYAALRSLGRSGVADIVERCSAFTHRLATEIGHLPGAEIASMPVINQGLVRFLAKDGAHDAFTDRVIHRIQHDGVAWFGGSSWRGMRVMRISVCNWRTTDDDITRSIESVRAALAAELQ